MENTNERRKPLFSSSTRIALMQAVVGRPSGTVIDLGGQAIDLVAIPFSKMHEIVSVVKSFGDLFDDVRSGEKSLGDAGPSVTERFETIKNLLKGVVRDSVELGDDGDTTFDEWFEALPAIPTLRTVFEATLKANAMEELGNALGGFVKAGLARVAAAAATLELPASTSPTQRS